VFRAQFAGRRGIAAAVPVIVGFFWAAVLPRATWPLIDGDVWWHIRAGEAILATGSVPRVDSWSIAGMGRAWTSQDWLANVVLALGHGAGPWGQTALSFLFGLLAVAAFAILWRSIAVRLPTVGWLSRVVWLSLGLVLAGPVIGVRVQVIDLVLAAGVIWVLWHYLMQRRARVLFLLPVLAALWANLHAGWALLFLIGGAVLVGEAADRLLRRRLDPEPLDWSRLGHLTLALLVAGAALAVNPNGLALYAYPLKAVEITALSRYIMEWFPASLDTVFGQLLAGFVVVAVLPTLLLGRWRLRSADALIIVGVTVMGYSAIRFLLITGPLAAAVAAVVLSPIISGSSLGRRSAGLLARFSQPRTGARAVVNLSLAVLLAGIGMSVALSRVSPATQAAEIARVHPVGAVAWLDEHEPGERMFNRYEWGGYIGRHRPHRLVFMDGRADVYGDELLLRYVAIIGVHDDPQVEFDAYRIDHALFPPGTPLARWFDASAAWERVYTDANAAIWVRR
jgi:hypothetical protein